MLKNLAFTPWSCCLNGRNWNRLDFFIVVVGWLEYPDYLFALQC